MNKTINQPSINLIAAVAVDGSIGAQGKLLWKIKADLAYYKARTYGNVIIMGLETFKTLPKIALKGRKTVVLCKVDEYDDGRSVIYDNVKFAFNINDALIVAKELANHYGCNDIYVAGGASIYKQLMSKCEYAFITWVQKSYSDADKHFPIQEFLSTFDLISESNWQHEEGFDISMDQLDEPNHKFTVYKNKHS